MKINKEFEITSKKLTKPTLSGSYTYNGTLQTATLSAEYDSLTMTASNNTRTDAGSQKIKVELKDKTNYAWDDGSTTDLEIDFVINPKSITPTIEEIDTKTYTGNLIEPTIVVKDGTTPLDKNTDYEERTDAFQAFPSPLADGGYKLCCRSGMPDTDILPRLVYHPARIWH